MGGGGPQDDVSYKKWQCHPVEFKEILCPNIDFKKVPCPYFFKPPCCMSLRPKKDNVDIRGLHPHN